jgi:hypothetical protein
VHIVEEHEKDALLGKLLGRFRKNGSQGRIMVFVLYKKVEPPFTPLLRPILQHSAHITSHPEVTFHESREG